MLLIALPFCGFVSGNDLSVFAAYSRTGDLGVDGGQVELKNPTAFGLRYEHRLSGIFAIENSLALTSDALTARFSDKRRGLYYTGNFVLNVPVDGMVPYFSVGVGLLHRFDDGVPSLGTTFLVNYGVGLKRRRVVGPLGLRVDYRRFRYTDVEDQSVSSHEISGGIIFTF